MAEDKTPVRKTAVKKATASKAPVKKVAKAVEVASPVEEDFIPQGIPIQSNSIEGGCGCDGACGCNDSSSKNCCDPAPTKDWNNGHHTHLTLFLVAVFALLFGLMVGSAASMNQGRDDMRFHHEFGYSNQYGYDNQDQNQYDGQQLSDGGQMLPLGMMNGNGQVTSLGTDLGSGQGMSQVVIQAPGSQSQSDGTTVTTLP